MQAGGAGAQVRANAIRSLLRPGGANVSLLVVSGLFAAAAIALTIATPMYIPQGRDACRATASYLDTYVILFTVRAWLAAVIGVAVAFTWNPGLERSEQPGFVQMILRAREFSTWFGLGTFIAGNFYLSRSNAACIASPLHKYARGILIVQYIELLLPAVIVALGCCAVCCCMPLLLRTLGSVGAIRTAQHPASDTQIAALPEEPYRAGRIPADGSGEEPSCAICMSAYAEGEPLRFLRCHHHFHKACLDQWLHINDNCPVCRARILGVPQGGGEGGDGAAAPAAGAAPAGAPPSDGGSSSVGGGGGGPGNATAGATIAVRGAPTASAPTADGVPPPHATVVNVAGMPHAGRPSTSHATAPAGSVAVAFSGGSGGGTGQRSGSDADESSWGAGGGQGKRLLPHGTG